MRKDWLLELAIEPAQGEDERVAAALAAIVAPLDLAVVAEPESGQLVLCGDSEARLQAALACLQMAVPIGFRCGAAQVAYRRAALRRTEIRHTHKRLWQGRGEFAGIVLAFAPGEPGAGLRVTDGSPPAHLPPGAAALVEQGIREAAGLGGPLGCALADSEVSLVDGQYHDEDSSEEAFRAAGRGAVAEAYHRGAFALVEPMVKLALLVPGPFAEVVTAALAGRGVGVEDVRPGRAATILAAGPMAALIGFELALAEMTGGRGAAAYLADGYRPVGNGRDPDDDLPAAVALRA